MTSRIVASPTETPVVMRQMLPTASVLKSTVVIWNNCPYIPAMSCDSASASRAINVRRIMPSGSRDVNSPWKIESKNKSMADPSAEDGDRYAAVVAQP